MAERGAVVAIGSSPEADGAVPSFRCGTAGLACGRLMFVTGWPSTRPLFSMRYVEFSLTSSDGLGDRISEPFAGIVAPGRQSG